MRKAERLFQILTLLRSRRQVITATDLAEKLQVSERTIYRDMQALSLSGVPIEGEAGVGYRLKSGFSIPPLMFDESELEALSLGVRMVQGWSDPSLGEAADRVLQKIRAVLPENLHQKQLENEQVILVPDYHREFVSAYSEQLRELIKQQQVVELSYQREDGEKSMRPVWPLGLVYWGRVWCLVAWCELRKDYRQFRLDRIQGLVLQGRQFHPTSTCCLKHYLSQYDC